MSLYLRSFGKKWEIPENSNKKNNWKFQLRPGGWIIAESEDGKRRKVIFHELKKKLSFSSKGYLWFGEWLEKPEERSDSNVEDDSSLIAQFPGKIRKILVQENDRASAGDPLLLMEAMKMEFVIRAPFEGKVVKILVKEGEQIAVGERFFEFQAFRPSQFEEKGKSEK